MDKPRYLSGNELVARGITKIDGSLPEIGSKDVVPSGSWLEQKQIKSALEARKDMIGVERIEKSGVLSNAEWCEELMLAKVTQKTGGHWQYLGHNIGNDVYLYPEEALYLMEVNCLLLKHNEVTISLQQAYSLLLRGEVKLLQYKVYASLSKLGYKVYRFKESEFTPYEIKINLISSPAKEIKRNNNKSDCTEKKELIKNESNQNDVTETVEVTDENIVRSQVTAAVDVNIVNDNTNNESIKMELDHGDINVVMDPCDHQDMSQECKNPEEVCPIIEKEDTDKSDTPINEKTANLVSSTEETLVEKFEPDSTDNVYVEEKSYENAQFNTNLPSTSNLDNNNEEISDNYDQNKDTDSLFYMKKLLRLEKIKTNSNNSKLVEKSFDKVPDFSQNQVVTVTAPEEQLIPRNIFLNNITYVLKLQNIRQSSKNTRPESAESRPFSANEEVNGDHIKRIRGGNVVPNNNWTTSDARFPSQQSQYFGQRQPFWRPNTNFFPFNMLFQRPFIPNANYVPRLRFFSRPPLLCPFPRQPSQISYEHRQNFPNFRKRKRFSKKSHFEAIKNLALRLKQLIQSGSVQTQNLLSLQSLIQSFNDRYQMRVRLTETFDVINDETILETITLDDDDQSNSKRYKKSENDTYCDNFKQLQKIALKLKELQEEGKANNRHKRALSKLVHKFNKSYGADVHVSNTFKVTDKRFITLDSSSDSDCVVTETSEIIPTRKKLKNPFNILKRLSEKPTPSATVINSNKEIEDNKYNAFASSTFPKNWLPSEEDFGRVEVVSKHFMNNRLIDSKKEQYLVEFCNSQPYDFESWPDLKKSFWRSIKETPKITEIDLAEAESSEENALNSLINPTESSDIASVLKKLSIIKCNKKVDCECQFTIDFDVYKRDVQNFKKSNRPKPHFRIICVSESSSPLMGRDVATLYSKYNDEVPILFAVVGRGSISYIQISPFDLPVYISSNDLE